MIFLVNTILGFLIAQIIDILRRKRLSDNSPVKFDLVFFWKDTKLKIIASLILSFSMSILVKLNFPEFADMIGKEWTNMNNLAYIIIGFCPELILQWVKRKYGFLQKEEVEGYTRK